MTLLSGTMNYLPLIFGLAFIAAFVTGIVLLTVGLRGRPIFSGPRCAKCDHDLRTKNFRVEDIGQCPECGSVLNAPKTVNFGKRQRWGRMIAGGITLILLSFVIPDGLGFYSNTVRAAAGIGPASGLFTPVLLARLPTTLRQPWDWKELEHRLEAGKLTQADVETAIAAVTADLNAQRAQGNGQEPLYGPPSFLEKEMNHSEKLKTYCQAYYSWFIHLATQRGLIGSEKLQAFCQAYYGAAPKLHLRDRHRAEQPIGASFEFDWPLNICDQTACWALKSIVADGHTSLKPTDLSSNNSPDADHPDRFSGWYFSWPTQLILNPPLPPGEHVLVFTFDIGVLPYTTVGHGLDGRVGTADKWPAPIAQWQTTVQKKIRVVGKDEAVVTLVTDEKENPFQETPLEIKEIIAQPGSYGGVHVVIVWKKMAKAPSLALSYKGELHAGTQNKAFVSLRMHAGNEEWSCYGPNQCYFEALPATVKTVDVVLTPDVRQSESSYDIERIWGKPVEFKDVPLKRYDLETKN